MYRTSSYGGGNPFGFVVTPWVKRLLIANAVMFVVTLALPSLRFYLGFIPAEIFPRIWSPVTYMFVHGGLFHLLFNMLALFFFGPPLEEKWGGHEFVKFYLITGLGGALLSFVFPNQLIIGASGAIYGIMVAFAMYWPNNPIYIWGIFPVKAKWLVGFLVGFSLLAIGGQAAGSGVAHLAHLGGAIAAFAYIRSPWGPSEWGAVPRRRSRPRQWRVFTSSGAEQPSRRESAAARPAPTRSAGDVRRSLDEVDRILDKISSHGLESLTEEERRMLDEASRRFRSN